MSDELCEHGDGEFVYEIVRYGWTTVYERKGDKLRYLPQDEPAPLEPPHVHVWSVDESRGSEPAFSDAFRSAREIINDMVRSTGTGDDRIELVYRLAQPDEPSLREAAEGLGGPFAAWWGGAEYVGERAAVLLDPDPVYLFSSEYPPTSLHVLVDREKEWQWNDGVAERIVEAAGWKWRARIWRHQNSACNMPHEHDTDA